MGGNAEVGESGQVLGGRPQPSADRRVGGPGAGPDLGLRSAGFRRLWSRHDVRESVSGTKTFRIPEVGDVVLDWDTYRLPGHPGPMMLVRTTEPGSADADRLQLVAGLQAARLRDAEAGRR